MKKKILFVFIAVFVIMSFHKTSFCIAEEKGKMIAFGDSITYGYLVEDNISFAKLIAKEKKLHFD